MLAGAHDLTAELRLGPLHLPSSVNRGVNLLGDEAPPEASVRRDILMDLQKQDRWGFEGFEG